MSGATGQPTHATLTDDQFFKMYEAYIQYARHENELIHHRTTWLVTTQGGFILILSFLIEKYFEVIIGLLGKAPNATSANQIQINSDQHATLSLFIGFWAIICLIGFFSSLSATYSIRAAIHAQASIKAKWERLFLSRADSMGFPHLMGGGSEIADRNGGHFAKRLPEILLLVWIIFLLLAILLAGYGVEIPVKIARFLVQN